MVLEGRLNCRYYSICLGNFYVIFNFQDLKKWLVMALIRNWKPVVNCHAQNRIVLLDLNIMLGKLLISSVYNTVCCNKKFVEFQGCVTRKSR